jgi:hypothetical protein
MVRLQNDELESILEEAAMAQFEVLFWCLPAGTRENHKIPQ